MNIDSVRIKMPLEILQDYNLESFKTKSETLPGNDPEISYSLAARKPLGLKNIVVNQNRQYFTLELSAKILKQDYFKLINLDTIEQVFSNVNATGLIRVDPPAAIQTAQVLRFDATNDLHVQNIPGHLRSLAAFKINTKYDCKIYPSSIVFDRKVSTKGLKEYQTFYCKATDMKKKDRELLKYVSIDQAKNVLRCETRFANFQQIRKNTNCNDLSLLSILETTTNPHLRIFDRVTKNIDRITLQKIQDFQTLIDMKQAFKHKDIQKEIAMTSILKLCNYDIELVKVYLATNSTANNSRLLKEFKTRLKAKNELDTGGSIDQDITEIRELLLAA